MFQTLTFNNINIECNFDKSMVFFAHTTLFCYSISLLIIVACEFYYNEYNELRLCIINNQSYENNFSSLGIPNIYNGYELSYVHDNLECVENYDQRIIYTYNASGIRTGKTIYNKATNNLGRKNTSSYFDRS